MYGYLKKGMLLTLAAAALQHAATAQQKAKVHIGLVYPVSSNGVKAYEYSNAFSLHLVAGVSGSERGAAFSGLANIIKDSAHGVQAAGFLNEVGNHANGAMFAGFMNHVRGNAAGMQAAGMLNITGRAKGLSLAGFGNIVTTRSNGDTIGNRLVQLAGFFNRAGDVNTQLAGFINVAHKVKGVQLAGLINIADSSDYPIGIINIIKNGERSMGVSIDETGTGLISFRSGGRVLYGIVGAGYNFQSNRNRYALEAGLGAHLFIHTAWRINAELATLALDDFKTGDYLKSGLRILPDVSIGSRLKIFAGPVLNFVTISTSKNDDLVSHYFWKKTSGDHFYGLYCGAVGGLHFRI